MTPVKATLDFIEDYRSHPVLWDSSDKNYTNKIKRNGAYEALSRKYNMSITNVKTKIKNLRSYFSKEQQKMYVKRSSAASDSKYETSWFAYKALLFIGDSLTPRYTKDTLQDEIPRSRNKEYILMTGDNLTENHVSSSPQTMDQVGVPQIRVTANEGSTKSVAEGSFATQLKTYRNEKRKRDDDTKKEDQAYSFLEIEANELTNKDDCMIFGQLVACQLKKLCPRNKAIARNRIQNLLFELEMEEMDGTSNSHFPKYATTDDEDAVL